MLAVSQNLRNRISDIGMTVAGLVMVFTPLALWMASDPFTYKIMLLVCGAGFFAVVFFDRIREDVPVSAEAPNLKVELLEQLIGELQNQREFTRRDPARLCKFVANGISDMDGRS